MPPTSNIRKSTAGTGTMVESQPNGAFAASLNASLQPRRTNSGRLIRVNTTRPANYYARNLGSTSAGPESDAALLDPESLQPPGFFPALQFFADTITALPKEVMKQFTLMKEVEAKIHGPTERLSNLFDQLMQQPVPSRKQIIGGLTGDGAGQQGLLSLTANASIVGSTNASLVNGTAGHLSAQNSVNGSLNGEEGHENDEEKARRAQYQELRMIMGSLLANLDEKNVVLTEANRVLSLQDMRMESVLPHVDEEISEEARLGSMTHWAYSDNRQKKPTASQAAASRRDLAAANSLAAAASVMRENDIQEARARAGREAAREKSKGKRPEPAGDSDFDEKPRKMHKTAKGKAVAPASTLNMSTTGLGIVSNGEQGTKRKKLAPERGGLAAVMMERSGSGSGKGAKSGKETPRSAPNTDLPIKRGPKVKPALPQPKKKHTSSAQASPMLASSPLAANFTSAMVDAPHPRPQSARLRQTSNAASSRPENTQEPEPSDKPLSVHSIPPIASTDEANASKRKAAESIAEPEDRIVEEPSDKGVKETTEKVEREDRELPEINPDDPSGDSRSNSNGHKNSGRTSKVGTPRTDSLPANETSTVRTRTTRSRAGGRGDGRDSSSVEPQMQGVNPSKHRRNVSNSHLVKQLAPFNRSPDLDRHKSRDDMDDDIDSAEDKAVAAADVPDFKQRDEPEHSVAADESRDNRRASARRPTSRRNTSNLAPSSPIHPPPKSVSPPASPPPITTRQRPTREPEQPPLVAEPVEEDDEEESEHDPDDPNEQKYCYCNRGSYGDMVACDNADCSREWFHLGCTELRAPPSADELWYCRDCRPKFRKARGRGLGRA